MSRQVKTHVARSVDPSVQGITASALPSSPDHPVMDDPTQREQDRDQHPLHQRPETVKGNASHDEQTPTSSRETETSSPVVKHRAKPTPKSVDRTLMISQAPPPSSQAPPPSSKPTTATAAGAWTQQQQKQLESALSQVPKGVSDRWDRIAELVPEKTKDECIQRFKHLAEVVRKKQQEKNTASQ